MIREAEKNLRRWREDPVAFVIECFGVQPDPWQVEGLRAFPHNQRIALKASKGCGKTTFDAWCLLNFLTTRPFPKIAATSISGDNLADGLWAETAKWMERNRHSSYPFIAEGYTWNKTRIFCNDHPENWFCSARSWSKSADSSQQANTLAGLHADYILFIIDESGGIPDAVMSAAEAALASGIETKLLQSGNPTHLSGGLYRACTSERDLWYVISITSDPDDPNRTTRVSKEWANEQISKWGRSNPWVLVNVFGQFPPSSLNSLLGVEEVEAAMKRRVEITDYEYSQKRLGVDVARFGDDRTVIFPRQGLMGFKPVVMRDARSNEIAARILQAKQKWNSEVEFIDGSGGFGSGVVDSMIQAGHSPYEIHFSGKAIDTRYVNKRAEMWFNMSEWVKRGGCLPQDTDLIKELTAPTYTLHNGKLLIEPKDQIKERLGYSTDVSDALALTFALPDMPASNSLEGMKADRGKLLYDYDPLDNL